MINCKKLKLCIFVLKTFYSEGKFLDKKYFETRSVLEIP